MFRSYNLTSVLSKFEHIDQSLSCVYESVPTCRGEPLPNNLFEEVLAFLENFRRLVARYIDRSSDARCIDLSTKDSPIITRLHLFVRT